MTKTQNEVAYEEVVDGELQKFEQVGKTIEGILVSYKSQPDKGKGPGHVYEVKTKGGVAAFFAPSLLHKKLSGIQVGSIVKIVYTEMTKTANGNTLKHFTVQHAPATEANLKAIGVEMYKTVSDSAAGIDEETARANAAFDGEDPK